MGLLGLIVGYFLASFAGGSAIAARGSAAPTPTVVQVPSGGTPIPTPAPPAGDVPPITKEEHIRGDLSKAQVAVIEYSDMECPFCKRVHPTYQQIVSTYGDEVVWVYRHFPLSFHANAEKEAEASECANELGGNDAFWKYTDKIFEKTTSGGTGIPLDQLPVLAKEIGLNETKFQSCLDSGKYAKHVQDDMAGGSAAGVSGTPGNIVLNLKTKEAREVSGAQPFTSFQSAIDAMLNAPTALGVPAANAAAPSGTAKTIKMTAELWKFTPSVVTVKQGEDVTLQIAATTGTHGITIPGLGINETIIQGQTASVKIPTDKAGTFDFACSVQCGSGHSDMKGRIIIES